MKLKKGKLYDLIFGKLSFILRIKRKMSLNMIYYHSIKISKSRDEPSKGPIFFRTF